MDHPKGLIDSFKGKYSFLSNFYFVDGGIQVKSKNVPSLEHAFQASKAYKELERDAVLSAKTAKTAKAKGYKVTMREDWEEVKVSIMRFLIECKFPGNDELSNKLLATGDAYLVEGNDWGDQFWGCVRPPDAQNGPWMGQNWLGKLLMERREALRSGVA